MMRDEWENIICVAQYLNICVQRQFPDSNPWVGYHLAPESGVCEFIVLHDLPAGRLHTEVRGELTRARFIEELENRFPSACIELFDHASDERDKPYYRIPTHNTRRTDLRDSTQDMRSGFILEGIPAQLLSEITLHSSAPKTGAGMRR